MTSRSVVSLIMNIKVGTFSQSTFMFLQGCQVFKNAPVRFYMFSSTQWIWGPGLEGEELGISVDLECSNSVKLDHSGCLDT